jgi:hypothetical protein
MLSHMHNFYNAEWEIIVNDELGRMWKENNGLFSGSVPAFA